MATQLAVVALGLDPSLSDFLVGILWVMRKNTHVIKTLGTMLSHYPTIRP